MVGIIRSKVILLHFSLERGAVCRTHVIRQIVDLNAEDKMMLGFSPVLTADDTAEPPTPK